MVKKVIVAMSGGVDSSVAAALLHQQGYQVTGVMMRLWSEPGTSTTNRCCTPDAMALARRVAAKLDIPFYAIDAQHAFREVVVERFINGYTQGETPNPCLVCNRWIRWSFLLERAQALGADYLATGHYARIARSPAGNYLLLRAVDIRKDQSYVLHLLGQEHLSHTLFPLGRYTKAEVRQIARDFGLPVAERSDSQDLCFLAGGDYRDFLARHAPISPQAGDIVNTQGTILGQHLGLAYYTIGQRKGLGISSSQPLYVIEKALSNNTLVVGTLEELGYRALRTRQINWISGKPPAEPFRAAVKIRYSAKLAPASVIPNPDGTADVRFDTIQRDITPGQAAVFYQDETCLGGGIIHTSLED